MPCVPFYLQPDGSLRTSPPPRGRSSQRATASTRPTRCRRSAATSPSPTRSCLRAATTSEAAPDVFGATDHLPLAARHDVLVFQTPPLERGRHRHRTAQREALGLVIRRRTPTSPRSSSTSTRPNRRLPGRLRAQSLRQHHSRPLPRLARACRTHEARRDLRIHHRSLPDRQRLQGRAPHPPRHLEQQLPALRRQSQHRRDARPNDRDRVADRGPSTTMPPIRRRLSSHSFPEG